MFAEFPLLDRILLARKMLSKAIKIFFQGIWAFRRKNGMSYLCSIPRWAFIEAYLAVPVRFLSSLYTICNRVRISLNFFARPKSIRNSWKYKKSKDTSGQLENQILTFKQPWRLVYRSLDHSADVGEPEGSQTWNSSSHLITVPSDPH